MLQISQSALLATQGRLVTITSANVEIPGLLKHTSQTGLHEPV